VPMEPAFPFGRPRQFRATVHGTVFADRARAVQRINAGDALTLVVDPALRDPRARGPDPRDSTWLSAVNPEGKLEGSGDVSPERLSPEVVWVHLPSGEPVGHLPHEIGRWLAPWMHRGGMARAHAIRVAGPESPSWRRLLLQVSCG